MKVTVFGFGNQKLYERINVAENYGGEPPFGGAGMALDFARAGHEVVLSDPFLDE
ncbi:MAG: H(2)-dependent methylenetetrahydromethanopterin dehydrogenase-related protein, partial [Methanopyri archaeon]|nr:H(2)-dependent methylenetetrahydromethanopterin dehydrogenase-related protein [Methanopyri archaeon]